MPAFPPKTNYAAGDVLTAAQMNDVGNALAAYQFTVGKNKIINGDFSINQRQFTSTTTSGVFGFDRWNFALSGATGTYSSETFTPGTAPVAGYESKNFARIAITTGNDLARLQQQMEGVRTFAGQTVTLSFWAKGTNPATSGNLAATFRQGFGTGGSPSSEVILTQQTFVLTANWTRYSLTFAIPSISGKTIGTNNDDVLAVWFGQGTSTSTDSWTLDLWGVQVEAGNVATAFQTATGTLAGERAACERYYQTIAAHTSASNAVINGCSYTSTSFYGVYNFRTAMRAAPTISATSGTNYYILYGNNASDHFDAIGGRSAQSTTSCYLFVNSGITMTQGYAYWIETNNASASVALEAEL